jgi:hypothetical protein
VASLVLALVDGVRFYVRIRPTEGDLVNSKLTVVTVRMMHGFHRYWAVLFKTPTD